MADNLPKPECDLCTAPARFILVDLLGDQLALCVLCVRLVQSWRGSPTMN